MPPLTSARLSLAMLALALGSFTIGTTEFVIMGLLPEVAAAVSVSIPTAGHAISAYALGVVVGAPLIAFYGARLPRKGLLLALMAAYAAANSLTALAETYPVLLGSRFLAGLPHGAYFGVASLVAAQLAKPDKRGRAVAQVMLGLAVANVIGVPAATWLGQNFGWRAAFITVVVLGSAAIIGVLSFVPQQPGRRDADGRAELAALRQPQMILTLLAGAIGFGGFFAVYSYIAPTVTEVAGLGSGAVPLFLLGTGAGMVAGTWLAGELADWSVWRSLLISAPSLAVLLVVFAAMAPYGYWSLPVLFAISVMGSVLVVNLQLRLMSVAGDAETMGAAANHAALNIANALGAWLGGLVIAAGWGYRAPAVVGAVLALVGFAVLVASARLTLNDRAVAYNREPAAAG